MTVQPIPTGYTSLTPFFVCSPAAAAVAFYTNVFGGTVVARNDLPDGKIAHCELQFPTGRMQLGDPAPDHNLIAPTGDDNVSRSTVLYCDDVDKVYAAAVEAGAKGYGEPSTFVTGDRYAAILDPFGHRWAIMTRVEDVSEAEAKRRVDEWLASQS
jgi:uncharacterized glyoxalase superfamily protein PhnB